jgi:tRNA modification GTPase
MHAHLETIAALATPPGMGALAVLRVSGPGVKGLITALCLKSRQVLDAPRTQVYTALKDQEKVLDYALAVFFPGPNSFTGEDVLELSLHGSSVVIRETLRAIYSQGVRPAEPGEFTKRAFLNGKLDLAQAEAVADLISSETEAQARIAREQLEGKLSHAVSDLGEPLRNLLAEIEAYIDFPEEDITPGTSEKWVQVVKDVHTHITRYLDSFSSGRVLREGISLALSGIPNAGKSSLMNYLLGEDRAIVTDVPGTTRDSIEERLELEGILFRLWDTAGIVEEQEKEGRVLDLPEQMGIERSWKLLERADAVLFLLDASSSVPEQLQLLGKIKEKNKKVILLASKADKNPASTEKILKHLPSERIFPVSSVSGEGVNELVQHIIQSVVGKTASEDIRISNERHYLMLKNAAEKLEHAQKAIIETQPSEYIAFEIRQALTDLQEIVGVTSTEDILGRIFSKFCIGK